MIPIGSLCVVVNEEPPLLGIMVTVVDHVYDAEGAIWPYNYRRKGIDCNIVEGDSLPSSDWRWGFVDSRLWVIRPPSPARTLPPVKQPIMEKQ